jgi:hypothetical protein
MVQAKTNPQPEDVAIDGILLTVGMRLRWFFRLSKMYGRLDSVGRFYFRTLNLLEQFRNRLAKDPRDKVYALLGLSDLDKGYEIACLGVPSSLLWPLSASCDIWSRC